MNQYDGTRFTATVADYLGIQAAKLTNLKGTPPCGLVTFRLTPNESLAASNIALTHQQCLRLRDDLNSLLTDPDSWLFTEDAG